MVASLLPTARLSAVVHTAPRGDGMTRARHGGWWIGLLTLAVACGTPMADEDEMARDETAMPSAAADPDAIRPFRIDVPEDVLADLRDRLARTRLPDEVPGTGWAYGTDLGYMRGLLAYWEHEFDWRVQEARLNEFDQFVTSVDGLDIHFVHQRSPNPDAIPLLITHGWPGSFTEFTKIIGPLTDPAAHGGEAADAFHVVIPSLPGFGFSEKPREGGFNPERMSEVLAALMERLGYERYGAQGGDWGSIITRWLAATHPDRVTGLHLNFVIAGPPPDVDDPEVGVPPEEMVLMRERQAFMSNERGYSAIQSTKPQTLGYGLNDSPAGLAAWIVEKFHEWSDLDDGNVESKFTKDELLTNITPVLGDAVDYVVHADLLRESERAVKPADRVHRRADGRRDLSQRAHCATPAMGRGDPHDRAVDSDATRGTFCRAGRAGAAG